VRSPARDGEQTREAIEVRCREAARAVRAEVAPAEIVRDDQHDVGLPRTGARIACRRDHRRGRLGVLRDIVEDGGIDAREGRSVARRSTRDRVSGYAERHCERSES
jgi:hypothetical protein